MATTTVYTKAGTDSKASPLAGAAELPSASGTAWQGDSSSAARANHRHPPPRVGGYPLLAIGGATPGMTHVLGAMNTAASENTQGMSGMLAPFPVHVPMTLTRLRVYLSSASDAGTMTLALYATGDRLTPAGAPLWTSSSIDATTTGEKTITLTQDLQPGQYFLSAGFAGATTPGSLRLVQEARALAFAGWEGSAAMPGMKINYDSATGWPASPTLSWDNMNRLVFWFAINADPIIA